MPPCYLLVIVCHIATFLPFSTKYYKIPAKFKYSLGLGSIEQGLFRISQSMVSKDERCIPKLFLIYLDYTFRVSLPLLLSYICYTFHFIDVPQQLIRCFLIHKSSAPVYLYTLSEPHKNKCRQIKSCIPNFTYRNIRKFHHSGNPKFVLFNGNPCLYCFCYSKYIFHSIIIWHYYSHCLKASVRLNSKSSNNKISSVRFHSKSSNNKISSVSFNSKSSNNKISSVRFNSKSNNVRLEWGCMFVSVGIVMGVGGLVYTALG